MRAISATEPPKLAMKVYGTEVPIPVSHPFLLRRDLVQVRVRNNRLEYQVLQGVPAERPAAPCPRLVWWDESTLGWIDVCVVLVRPEQVVIFDGDVEQPPSVGVA